MTCSKYVYDKDLKFHQQGSWTLKSYRDQWQHWASRTPNSLYNQLLHFLDGTGVTKDKELSFICCAEAARSGHHDAVLAMGWYYLNGVGVDRDIEGAEIWYKKSAHQGDTRAMYSLGYIAYQQRDDAKALKWFKRASKKGHHRSVYWIGKLYWHGRYVGQDKVKAMQLFNQAANKNAYEAQRTLNWFDRILAKRRAKVGRHKNK
ncbi:MAG: tetratricopeptide repeat protein [Motiliproteus sp.]